MTFMVTAGMIGGATYATTSSTTDVYYACASLTGNIRASSIRLNVAPIRCSSTTDHVVQWDAAGQQIQPKAGRVIELANGMTFPTETGLLAGNENYTWDSIDTSECKDVVPFIKFESAIENPDPSNTTSVNVASYEIYSSSSLGLDETTQFKRSYLPEGRSPNDYGNYPDYLIAPLNGDTKTLAQLHESFATSGGSSGYGGVRFFSRPVYSAPRTSLEISFKWGQNVQLPLSGNGVSVTIAQAALYCTPY